ncbi:MAG: hypothetical protein AB1631_23605 [Acidobacteriota bacterium]
MAESEMKAEYHFWDWSNQDNIGCRDYLLVAGDKLYFEGTVQTPKFEKLKEGLSVRGPQTVQEKVEAESKKKFGKGYFARVIRFNDVRAVEYVPLLTTCLVRIRYMSDKGKEEKLSLKVPADNGPARSIFDELRDQIAPQSAVESEQASKWTAIRGPILSLFFGGGWLALAALASTTDERAWQEEVFFLHAVVGWLIRFLGPVWLTIIAVVWTGASLWMLISRLKNPLIIQVWRAN